MTGCQACFFQRSAAYTGLLHVKYNRIKRRPLSGVVLNFAEWMPIPVSSANPTTTQDDANLSLITLNACFNAMRRLFWSRSSNFEPWPDDTSVIYSFSMFPGDTSRRMFGCRRQI
ncbi:hypothetical protein AVEN_111645-1 [Araneus ventricosus]|uniref:Uncharacterized protein n=1 Tax=Araneus ventricosus TaxID=182803 RepID=A0A4Y2C358_ARAVE|nr:hypothetical protein AVEN_111645-1 [Araneus ventricosus]